VALPSAAHLALGGRLRALRKQRSLTGTALAEQVGMTQSKISKLETGSQIPTTSDLESLAKALGLEDHDLIALIADAEQIREGYQRWDALQAAGIAVGQKSYGLTEETAHTMVELAVSVVPGLLQTQEYADAVFGLVLGPTEDRRGAVAERLARQANLGRFDARFVFVLLESVLRMPYGSYRVMRDQIQHIRTVADRPHIKVEIVPLERLLPGVPQHGFTLFDAGLAVVETVTGMISATRKADVQEYQEIVSRLRGVALEDSEATKLLDRLSGTYATRADRH
jgi:transcriptional regulator with XRE-family HTH domain